MPGYYYDIYESTIVWSNSVRYDIYLYDTKTGKSKLIIKKFYKRVPISKDDLEYISAFVNKRNVCNKRVPKLARLIKSINFDENGDIWVFTNNTSLHGFMKYDINGKFLGKYSIKDNEGGKLIKSETHQLKQVIFQAGQVYFMYIDDIEGMKIYRAKIPK